MKPFKRRQSELPERRRISPALSDSHDSSNTFRRGRTLTGSMSSLVRTPNEAGADLKSSRVHAHALTKKRRHLTAMFVAVALVTTSLYVLVSQFTAQAVIQASPDSSWQLTPDYADAIDDYFVNNTGERWRMFTNTDQLTAYVQTVAPEVSEITLRGSAGFGKSRFEVTFRKPIASWDVNGRQLYVDAEGVPFSRNYYKAPSLRITDESGLLSTTVGQSIMSNRFMSYIGQVIGLAKDRGYTVQRIVIPEGMTRQIHVHLKGVAYPVKLSSDRPAGEGVDDMAKTVAWLKKRGITPEYADVRVSGRVFYRE
jgi:hypothetical protein